MIYEDLTYRNVGCAMKVHSVLGNGLQDAVYSPHEHRHLKFKHYELKDHLSNVRVVFSDLKQSNFYGPSFFAVDNDVTQPYDIDLIAVNNYYPFGMLQPGLNYSSESYRFGFNGKENDNEVKGVGNQQDYGMRIYDPRLGKFLSVDPLTKDYPWYTPYQFASNTPIQAIDLDGEDVWYVQVQGRLAGVGTGVIGFTGSGAFGIVVDDKKKVASYGQLSAGVSVLKAKSISLEVGYIPGIDGVENFNGLGVNIGAVVQKGIPGIGGEMNFTLDLTEFVDNPVQALQNMNEGFTLGVPNINITRGVAGYADLSWTFVSESTTLEKGFKQLTKTLIDNGLSIEVAGTLTDVLKVELDDQIQKLSEINNVPIERSYDKTTLEMGNKSTCPASTTSVVVDVNEPSKETPKK